MLGLDCLFDKVEPFRTFNVYFIGVKDGLLLL